MNLLLCICLLADIDLPGSWPATIQTEVGLLGLLTIGVLILTFAHLCKKMFGAKPPLDDQIKEGLRILRREIHREKNSVLKEVRLKLEPLASRVANTEQEIADIQLDRTRKWMELTTELHGIASKLEYMRGVKEGEQTNDQGK